jgi:hypothetical protein
VLHEHPLSRAFLSRLGHLSLRYAVPEVPVRGAPYLIACVAFDERRVGLDHLSFDVESRTQLDGWMARLVELDIPHSGISDEPMWDVLVFRDPDNVQLEFIYVKPAATELLTGSE